MEEREALRIVLVANESSVFKILSIASKKLTYMKEMYRRKQEAISILKQDKNINFKKISQLQKEADTYLDNIEKLEEAITLLKL